MMFDTTPIQLQQRARTAVWLLGWVVPSVVILVVATLMLSWRHELPNPIVTHWGASDQPDGFMPFWGHFASSLAFLAGLPILTTGIASWQLKRGTWALSHRILIAMSVGVSAMNGLILTMTVYVQRGIDDAVLAPGISHWVIAAVVLGFTFGTIAFFLQPRSRLLPKSRGSRIDVDSESDRVSRLWEGSVSASRTVSMLVIGLAVLLWIGSVWIAWSVERSGVAAVTVGLTGSLVAVAYAAFLARFDVTASSRGLRVRSAFGWPVFRIPLAEIESVEARHVEPFAEFGGWGYRFGAGGRSGVVIRAGESIEVTRVNGKRFVVTVDGAARGAAVLRAHVNSRLL